MGTKKDINHKITLISVGLMLAINRLRELHDTPAKLGSISGERVTSYPTPAIHPLSLQRGVLAAF